MQECKKKICVVKYIYISICVTIYYTQKCKVANVYEQIKLFSNLVNYLTHTNSHNYHIITFYQIKMFTQYR